MDGRDDFAETIGFAKAAIEQLKRHQIPATPRHFEFWYAYAAGFDGGFCRAVEGLLRERGRLTLDDMLKLQRTFLSQGLIGERIEEVGSRVASDIDEIAGRIEAALGEAASFGAELRIAGDSLTRSSAGADVRSIVGRLIEATRDIEERKQRLEAQLADSRAELRALQTNLESVRYEQMNDQLTTLATRKHFDLSIERAVADAEAESAPLALLLTDIDHFKSFNDRYGHQTGDQVLRLVALATKQSIKGQDIACRYGGEEFAIILPRTGPAQAAAVGENIRATVMAKELVKRPSGENLGRITISIGIAAYRPGDTPQSLIERADTCLYAAKRAGRNRVVCEADDAERRSVA